MWYIRIIGIIFAIFGLFSFICWLSDVIEEHIKHIKAINAENKMLKAKLDVAETVINHQKGVIRALEYISRYPLFTSNVPVRNRKVGR